MESISENNCNDKRGLTDLEWVNELYLYLQNKPLDKEAGITHLSGIKLNEKKAFRVIWFLQEHLRILPDTIEKCDDCGVLFDTNSEGYYSERGYRKKHHFCTGCGDYVPAKYFD